MTEDADQTSAEAAEADIAEQAMPVVDEDEGDGATAPPADSLVEADPADAWDQARTVAEVDEDEYARGDRDSEGPTI